ncbi:hypothetical protein RRF57_002322 [Xylaria bambusicola]|uniref:Uncharacterized protein n=1 Tax=Xylaria bambusicola TaxID=326684 RepID=A0AAN7UF43_9PEZI
MTDPIVWYIIGISLLALCVFFGILITVTTLAIKYRPQIVSGARRLQSILKIPPCLAVVSHTAPGITNRALEDGAVIAVFSVYICVAIFVGIAILGKTKTVGGIIVGIVGPICVFLHFWSYFIFARRRFDLGETDPSPENAEENQGLTA